MTDAKGDKILDQWDVILFVYGTLNETDAKIWV